MTEPPHDCIDADVVAVLVALVDGEPAILTVGDGARLPSGPLLEGHRSLQAAVRAWVESQTGLEVGYLEQLYTFADRGSRRHISVSYLGLTPGASGAGVWVPWYGLFPWEDRRDTPDLPPGVGDGLAAWASDDPDRRARVAALWGGDGRPWEPDLALHRYEMLYEAGLIAEAPPAARRPHLAPGRRMDGDHRRIAATGVARLRAKIQYRPVVFELLPLAFTLGQLQACVEALAGRRIHTQNFRRLVTQQDLVRETGESTSTGGRPARLYRFRGSVVEQRRAAGTKLPTTRVR